MSNLVQSKAASMIRKAITSKPTQDKPQNQSEASSSSSSAAPITKLFTDRDALESVLLFQTPAEIRTITSHLNKTFYMRATANSLWGRFLKPEAQQFKYASAHTLYSVSSLRLDKYVPLDFIGMSYLHGLKITDANHIAWIKNEMATLEEVRTLDSLLPAQRAMLKHSHIANHIDKCKLTFKKALKYIDMMIARPQCFFGIELLTQAQLSRARIIMTCQSGGVLPVSKTLGLLGVQKYLDNGKLTLEQLAHMTQFTSHDNRFSFEIFDNPDVQKDIDENNLTPYGVFKKMRMESALKTHMTIHGSSGTFMDHLISYLSPQDIQKIRKL